MSFKRSLLPHFHYEGDELTSALISIGVRLSGQKSKRPVNIEDVLLSGSIEGVLQEDYRVLGLLVDWVEVHGRMINVDRLISIVEAYNNIKIKYFWKAVGESQKVDPRWKKTKNFKVEGRVDLLESGTDFLVKKNGEDERFKNTSLRVPKLTLRHRLEDIQTPVTLAKMNSFYRARLMISPSFKADVWAYLEFEPEISTSELARISYSSFATAWQTKKDFEIVNGILETKRGAA